MAVAKKKKAAPKKKAVKKTTKKATAKKTTAKKKPAAKKKTAAKRTTVKKKTTAKKTTRKTTTRKTTAKKATAKRTTKKATAKKKTKAKRKPNPAFMRPWSPSEALAAVVGAKPLPRTEVTKKIWAYIKKNKLQDAINRRMINADEKLKKIFGGKKKVSMFEMTKLISKHLK